MFNEFEEEGDVSVWKLTKDHADYLVTSEKRVRVYRELRKKHLNHTVLIMDVQNRINAERAKPIPWTNSSLRKGYRLNFKSYANLEIIDEYIEHVKSSYQSIARVSTIGRSVENRPIQMIRISNGNLNNKAIFLVGGQHAREWVSIASALYIANCLVSKYDEQPDYIKNKDWYIIPLVNPDGYQHTIKSDRLWRKNRRVNPTKECPGVDLNRNYPKNWDVQGVTAREECKSDYAGPSALSEPETKAIVDLLESMDKVPSAFVDLHSYGQLILYPWGNRGESSPHEKYLISTALSMKQLIVHVTGKVFEIGTASGLLYPVSGTATDYFHSKEVPLVYAIECRGGLQDSAGFLLPADQIENSGKEILGAVKDIAKVIDRAKRRSGSPQTWF